MVPAVDIVVLSNSFFTCPPSRTVSDSAWLPLRSFESASKSQTIPTAVTDMSTGDCVIGGEEPGEHGDHTIRFTNRFPA